MNARLAPQEPRAPCSHKNAIAKFFKVAEFAVVPDMSAQSRALYHYLGNGFVVADSWYRELDAPGEASGLLPNTYKAKNLL